VKVSLSNTLYIRYLNQAHHQYVDLDILNRKSWFTASSYSPSISCIWYSCWD